MYQLVSGYINSDFPVKERLQYFNKLKIFTFSKKRQKQRLQQPAPVINVDTAYRLPN
jgi:hypothetical protein